MDYGTMLDRDERLAKLAIGLTAALYGAVHQIGPEDAFTQVWAYVEEARRRLAELSKEGK